ncbi:MAG: M20/M25/M40 family metallo-hydrolase [Candidatus Koribacter versatilis]|uniref:M20/M25/M40 family metallo-hydrolase n=1 Tax=Candidatus Korobacter versatilis TaxID=658062 RepID=A0A932A727_9BACT|nr:M20/M25/M40 family metallo-hydrolase [Candidatus Koribacter versatilis]
MSAPRIDASTQSLTPQQEVARVAGARQFHAVMDWLRAHTREIADRQMELTAIPAPPFGEAKRAAWLAERFRELGLRDVETDEVGNVFGVRRAAGAGKAAKYLAMTAHIDTVFAAGTEIDVRREGVKLLGPGISDNGAGVSALLAMAQALEAAKIALGMPVVFIGNVGEEGEGDLRGMRQIFRHDGPWREKIEYTLVVDGAATDTVIAQGLGSRRFEVTVRGAGGHSWSDFGVPNPIVALARAVARFSVVQVPTEPKTTFNIGAVSGGTSVNSIPESATMRVDLRSASGEQIDKLEAALRRAVHEAVTETKAAQAGQAALSYDIKGIGSRPAAELKDDARMLQVIRAVDAQLGNTARMQRASTDANIPLSLGMEAIAIGAGGAGGGAHTLHEWYDPTNRDLGFKRIVMTVMTLAGVE